MEKTITIDGKEVRFKTTGATALRYKSQFQKDYFKEILKLAPLANIDPEKISPKDLEALDFEVFFNIAWVMARTADPSIPSPIEWLDQFDEFPIVQILPDLQELIESSFQTSKKN
jgi:hypothetical protein